MSIFDAGQALLRLIDAEQAHGLAIKAMQAGLYPRAQGGDPASLKTDLWSMTFPNPLGMAAGFDKNAQVPDAILAAGFGFAEVGTLTPKPQAGNPRPRLFRLGADKAVINRMGFNNDGHAAALQRLEARARTGIVGVNVGANKDSADRIADYVAGIRAFAPVASYFTVNVSSPNTPGLRDLQARKDLDVLLTAVLHARDESAHGVPVLLKIAPDLSDDGLQDIAEVGLARNIDGIIVSNTTISRPSLKEHGLAKEAGGLSGAPLFDLSTRVLARTYRLTEGKIPLIGVGGISSAETAYQKIRAGASLLQIYSALVYSGYGLVGEIKRGLAERLQRDGCSMIGQAVGEDAARWCEES